MLHNYIIMLYIHSNLDPTFVYVLLVSLCSVASLALDVFPNPPWLRLGAERWSGTLAGPPPPLSSLSDIMPWTARNRWLGKLGGTNPRNLAPGHDQFKHFFDQHLDADYRKKPEHAAEHVYQHVHS